MTRPLSARRAREIIDGATLVKAPDWADTRQWHVVAADRRLLVVISPSYGGASQSGRNGWKWQLPGQTPAIRPEPTREKAAVAGLGAWQRTATRKEN
ncbi:hypothetical protein ACWEQ7_04325 [Streptomyces sp. NPDC004069]